MFLRHRTVVVKVRVARETVTALGAEAPVAAATAAASAAALAAAYGDGVPRLREEELRAQQPLFRKNRRGIVLRRAARREGRVARRDGMAKVVVLDVPPYAVVMVLP